MFVISIRPEERQITLFTHHLQEFPDQYILNPLQAKDLFKKNRIYPDIVQNIPDTQNVWYGLFTYKNWVI